MQTSIVIPVFNRANLVIAAIESAIAQTVPCEVLLVDHGSTDGVAQVAARYGERIRYIRREMDRGPIACWIDGARQATGKYLHFTYDDDWLQPTFIERCLACFTDDVAFVYTRARLHGGHEDERVILSHPGGRRPIIDIVRHLMTSQLTISPGCALFRREDVLINLLPEVPCASGIYGKGSGVGEDLLLFLLTSLHYPTYAHVPEPLADFLAHSGSITVNAQQTGRNRQLAQAYAVAKAYYAAQPGAITVSAGLRRFLFKLRWSALAWLSDAR